MQTWDPTTWRRKPCQQEIVYPCTSDIDNAVAKLSQSAPLVTPEDCDRLMLLLAKAANKQAFFIQAGDCAETFADCQADILQQKVHFLQHLATQLQNILNTDVITIGRIAGQYAKPRTALWESCNSLTLANYRGDLINAPEFDNNSRQVCSDRLLQAYQCAQKTLEYLDSSTIFTSHEAMNLYYEQALSRQATNGKWYNLSTHFPWLGVRTHDLNSAHIEYIRGINNPIAIKIGPQTNPQWLQQLVLHLNPDSVPGHLCLLTRLGHQQVKQKLPQLIKAVQATGVPVVWACDPMHGNTYLSKNGFKTRRYQDIFSELELTLQSHREHNSYLAGVHLELTYENVTECLGGPSNYREQDLGQAYKSLVDPRLNAQQSLALIEQFPCDIHETFLCRS